MTAVPTRPPSIYLVLFTSGLWLVASFICSIVLLTVATTGISREIMPVKYLLYLAVLAPNLPLLGFLIKLRKRQSGIMQNYMFLSVVLAAFVVLGTQFLLQLNQIQGDSGYINSRQSDMQDALLYLLGVDAVGFIIISLLLRIQSSRKYVNSIASETSVSTSPAQYAALGAMAFCTVSAITGLIPGGFFGGAIGATLGVGVAAALSRFK